MSSKVQVAHMAGGRLSWRQNGDAHIVKYLLEMSWMQLIDVICVRCRGCAIALSCRDDALTRALHCVSNGNKSAGAIMDFRRKQSDY